MSGVDSFHENQRFLSLTGDGGLDLFFYFFI